MRRAVLLMVAVPLACPTAVRANTAVVNGPPAVVRAIEAMHTPVVGAQTVLLQPCPGYPDLAGCNFPTADSPIYIRPDAYSRGLLYREMGGRFATVAMGTLARKYFADILNTHLPWDGGGVDANYLNEVFEDAYADCAFGYASKVTHPWDSEAVQERWIDDAGYDPTARQHRQVCALIRLVGRPHRIPAGPRRRVA